MEKNDFSNIEDLYFSKISRLGWTCSRGHVALQWKISREMVSLIFHPRSRILLTRALDCSSGSRSRNTRRNAYMYVHAHMYKHVGKCSHAHPRRDRSWEKVRQSEANLVRLELGQPLTGTVPHFPDTRKSPRCR